MIKKHKKSAVKLMRRSARVYLNELNEGKANKLKDFLRTCHDMTQYFVDLFWQRKDFSATLADLPTVHSGRKFVLYHNPTCPSNGKASERNLARR